MRLGVDRSSRLLFPRVSWWLIGCLGRWLSERKMWRGLALDGAEEMGDGLVVLTASG